MRQMEALLRRVQVVELKRCLMAFEATEPTTPSSLIDEDPLDPPTPFGHCGDIALQASKASIRTPEEGCVAVRRAAQIRLRDTRLARDFAFPPPGRLLGFESFPPDPIANRRVPGAKPLGDFSDRLPILNQPSEGFWRNHPLRRVSLRPARLKPVLLQPIAHCRWVSANQVPDRLKRHLFRQALFEKALLHSQIIAFTADRKFRSPVTRRRARRERCAGPGRRARG